MSSGLKIRTTIFGVAAIALLSVFSVQGREVVFNAPATHFTESTPLGNGRLGMMAFGDPYQEVIVLNESGMWSGSPQDADREDAYLALPNIRELLLDRKFVEAEALVNENFTCKGAGSGLGTGANDPYGCYQTLGKLRMDFSYNSDEITDSELKEYRRELDLETATATVEYQVGKTTYRREMWVSKPDEIAVVSLKSDGPDPLNFSVCLDREERFQVEAGEDSHSLLMIGQLNDGYEGENGVRYACVISVSTPDGSVKTVESENGLKLEIQDATEATLLLTAATDIKTFAGRKVEDARKQAIQDLDDALALDLDALRNRHVEDYQQYFDRVQFSLGNPDKAERSDTGSIATFQRLKSLAAGEEDLDLYALYFDFGRYLLISSSRPGGLPANLQGIWAEEIQTPWNGDWHTNINVQMNYWPAEVCNLSELHQPLFSLIESQVEPGSKTAKSYYNADGWVSFLLANPWGYTSPGESASWGSTVSCSAWMCQHLWEHYLYTGDDEFLKWAYPILKGSAEFYEDILVQSRDGQWLVTSPSNSPENAFLTESGESAHVCMGPTADQQLLRYLFNACIEAAGILGVDSEFSNRLSQKFEKLAPTRLGPDGRVMEWQEPFEEADPHHRHVAHLWGLFPGNEISPLKTPELAEGARKTLNVRGDASTGWSSAFKLGMWARLGDGERAEKLLKQHLKPADLETTQIRWSGGTYANLFGSHPPFQIDANFGGTASIAEMLMQSQPHEITLLPALPASWTCGSIEGLRVRGGYEVDLKWNDGFLKSVTITSDRDQTCELIYGETHFQVSMTQGTPKHLEF